MQNIRYKRWPFNGPLTQISFKFCLLHIPLGIIIQKGPPSIKTSLMQNGIPDNACTALKLKSEITSFFCMYQFHFNAVL